MNSPVFGLFGFLGVVVFALALGDRLVRKHRGPPLQVGYLSMPEDGLARNRREVVSGVEVLEGEVDYFLRFDPLVVHVLETFQVDYLLKIY